MIIDYLIKLSALTTKFLKYLGISPYNNPGSNDFDIVNGCFINSVEKKRMIPQNIVISLHRFLGTNFDEINTTVDSSLKRKQFLEFMINYLEFHIDSFKRPKSLNVLYDLFKS